MINSLLEMATAEKKETKSRPGRLGFQQESMSMMAEN
jgi:hypothetical protein